MKLLDYFKRKFYSLKAANLLVNIKFSELVDVMKNENSLFEDQPSDITNLTYMSDGEMFDRVYFYREENTYVIYYKHIRFYLLDGDEKIIKISILGENQSWEIKSSGKKLIIDSPDTKAYTVYTFCDIMMPTGRMMSDERYTKGNWDELVFKQMNYIIDFILSFKERNKFNKLYACKNC